MKYVLGAIFMFIGYILANPIAEIPLAQLTLAGIVKSLFGLYLAYIGWDMAFNE